MRFTVLLGLLVLSCAPRVHVPNTSEGRRCQRECMTVYNTCMAQYGANGIGCSYQRSDCLQTCDGAYIEGHENEDNADSYRSQKNSEEAKLRRQIAEDRAAQGERPPAEVRMCYPVCAINAVTLKPEKTRICCDESVPEDKCRADTDMHVVNCAVLSVDAGS